MKPKDVVIKYWEAMNSNDFSKAADCLSEDFVCKWPQSKELIMGKENFMNINSNYPTKGKWKFQMNNILEEEEQQVVSDVSVTDGTIFAKAITFHKIENNLIVEQTEYWPEEYEAPEWRKRWVDKMD